MLTATVSERKIYDIPMEEVYCDHNFNCRGRVAATDVIELSQSIEKYGLRDPIDVQPYSGEPGKLYRILAGHRRYVACRIQKFKIIACKIHDKLTEIEAHTFNLVENIARQDLNISQEAHALEIYKKLGWKDKDVATEVNMSRGWVQIRFALLDLPEEIQKVAAAGMLTSANIMELKGMPKAKQFEAVKILKEARERGLKKQIQLAPPKPINPLAKRERDKNQIFKMQDIMREVLGNNLATRALAWCAGTITDFDLHRDIRDAAELIGKKYVIPKEMLAAI